MRKIYVSSGVTAGGAGGKCLPGSSDVGPFLKIGLLNSASFAFLTSLKT